MRNSDFMRTFSTGETNQRRVRSIRFDGGGMIFIRKPYKTPGAGIIVHNALIKMNFMKGTWEVFMPTARKIKVLIWKPDKQ